MLVNTMMSIIRLAIWNIDTLMENMMKLVDVNASEEVRYSLLSGDKMEIEG